MSSEVPAIFWSGNPSFDSVIANLSDSYMVKCLEDLIRDLTLRINQICRRRKWTLEWLKDLDPESLDDDAKLILEAQALLDYLEYLRRGSG